MQLDPERPEPAELATALGVDFVPELLEAALTHTSFAFEHGGVAAGVRNSERLEFIGDRILGQAVAVWLFHERPDADEGVLSRFTHALVSTTSLAEIARGIHLGDYLRLGKGELRTGGRDKDSLLADAMEAVFGAAYLSAGADVARDLVLRLVTPKFEEVSRLGAALDPKTALQELAAAAGGLPPVYEVVAAGPDHDRTFRATVRVLPKRGPGLLVEARGDGSSKKAAELAAAMTAWRTLAHAAQPGPGRARSSGEAAPRRTSTPAHGATATAGAGASSAAE